MLYTTAPYGITPLPRATCGSFSVGLEGAAATGRVGFAFLWWRAWVWVRGTVLPTVQVTACEQMWCHHCLPNSFPFEIFSM